ncbi:NAD(P)-binding protein [Xylona heveae TC161]|uniref:NAD(P)-binding protein n=1 Tax=Xylona heveae (strain CBS 132557 / TC161) TaxID=1328760 RepID=A0A164ZCT6_XYLHT|nr:NAD(P)-binding protein [Xylona heveae TC161]KZF18944.1 NAD(P)-binding protein [Xylona heveae TC161]
MPFSYKKVLVLGATSGIGEALAERFISEGSFLIVTGRRKERLDVFVEKHGKNKSEGRTFDITKLDSIPSFVASVTKDHPDIDCVFLNSGIQRGFDFSKPESVDLGLVELEFLTNYLSYIHFVKAILPFLQSKKSESGLIFTTSSLALVPLTRCPNYCATKAALHQFIMALRKQIQSSPIKVIEVFPPAVQTELHDKEHQPDIENGRQMGMPIDQFVEETYAGLAAGKEQIPVGPAKDVFEAFEKKRQELYKA